MKCPSCKQPIDIALTRAGLGLHPACDPLDVHPDIVASELFSIIATGITAQPRSTQRRIGPSELGAPCDRRVGYKLAGTPEVNRQGVPWKPAVGTAVHSMIADFLAAHEIATFETSGLSPRWHVEERVTVGTIGDTAITGSCDLFDAHSGLVIDWKTTSPNQLREKYRPHGPGEQYEVQAMLYGLGWENAGHAVRNVMLVFLVRDGDFDQRYVWSAPYDRERALAALARATSIQLALDALGPDFTIETLPTSDSFCRYCPWFKKGSSTLASACPGHPTTRALKTPDTSGPAFGTVTPPREDTAA